ncbi:purine-binding chemotaxis protein CheW [Sphingomonas jinjuensis]|uniref:Purine-binding chemotaxis protein CheW n=1 Tax=Sphingomonas jinjuensis TaxID=535907 RepID=A0A840F610_9SPHN|nr:chemotaxis protein CheW [Sphingomonas jinjuensis]MBB4153209.1 purine-binding chemotaxis protein CheW [Sphingomonas jinjuensis]
MTAAGQDIQVVVFGLGEEEFGLPVTSVREILDHRPAYRVPDAPSWFLGLTDVRGLSVPMVDLRARMGMMQSEPTVATRILVVDLPGRGSEPLSLGLVVDRVLDVSTFAADSVEASPGIGGRWQSSQIEAILRRGADFVALLNVARLFGAGDDGDDIIASFAMAA